MSAASRPEDETTPRIAEPGMEAAEREAAALADDAVVGGEAREGELVARLVMTGMGREPLGRGQGDADVEELEPLDLHALSSTTIRSTTHQASRDASPSPSVVSSRQNLIAPGRQRSRSSWKREIARRPIQLPP